MVRRGIGDGGNGDDPRLHRSLASHRLRRKFSPWDWRDGGEPPHGYITTNPYSLPHERESQ